MAQTHEVAQRAGSFWSVAIIAAGGIATLAWAGLITWALFEAAKWIF
jgi:hypothetical protein